MLDLLDVIKTVTKPDQSLAQEDVHFRCAQLFQAPISNDNFQNAVRTLIELQEIYITHNGRILRIEPDFPESDLEDPIENFLSGDWACQNLGLRLEESIFIRTARGGTRDTGLFSRPDFTIATIRRMKYDPLRHLDVLTFELKNRAGATLMAVHEALAHTRFAHYSFLVCPRSHLRPQYDEELRNACVRHGLGLIMFDLSGNTLPDAVTGCQIDVQPSRVSSDPFVVEQYLEARLPEDELCTLERIANSK